MRLFLLHLKYQFVIIINLSKNMADSLSRLNLSDVQERVVEYFRLLNVC